MAKSQMILSIFVFVLLISVANAQIDETGSQSLCKDFNQPISLSTDSEKIAVNGLGTRTLEDFPCWPVSVWRDKYEHWQSSAINFDKYFFYDQANNKILLRKKANIKDAIKWSMAKQKRGSYILYAPVHHDYTTAVDITTATGVPIYSVDKGVVESTSSGGGYGCYIKIKHDKKSIKGQNKRCSNLNCYRILKTLYAHLLADSSGCIFKVSKGDTISAGQQIGFVDTTGSATGSHLHLEVYVKEYCQDSKDNYYTINGAKVKSPSQIQEYVVYMPQTLFSDIQIFGK